jgi:hypothetical protein
MQTAGVAADLEASLDPQGGGLRGTGVKICPTIPTLFYFFKPLSLIFFKKISSCFFLV